MPLTFNVASDTRGRGELRAFYVEEASSRARLPLGGCRAANVVQSVCTHGFLPLKFSPTFHPAPLPSWENGANVIWLTPLPVPGSGAEGLSHGQIGLHLPGSSG